MSVEDSGREPVADGAALGASFAATNSATTGGDLGEAFVDQNKVLPEQRASYVRAERARSRRRRWVWISLVVVLLVVGLLVGLHARGAHAKAAAKGSAQGTGSAAGGRGAGGAGAAAAITVGQTKTGDMNVYVDALGTVTPVYTVTVYSQITGRVLEVAYREGQLVTKGQLLIQIDPRPYQANLTTAEGNLLHDQGLLAEAKIDFDRYREAFARNAIARQQFEDQAQLVKQYEGTVKADEGTVAYDRVQLGYCRIVAPISGRVGLRLVDPGNTVFSGTGATLVVITQLKPITVVFNVSEDDLPAVETELKASKRLAMDAYDRTNLKRIETGTLGALDNQVDTATGTVKFRANFANTNLVLFPNQFVNARLLVHTLRGVVLAPSAAVQHNGTAAFVYVVKPNKTVTVQAVETQASDEQATAVTGVPAGTNVATSGFDRLDNGSAVQVRGNQVPAGSAQGRGSNGSAGGSTAP